MLEGRPVLLGAGPTLLNSAGGGLPPALVEVVVGAGRTCQLELLELVHRISVPVVTLLLFHRLLLFRFLLRYVLVACGFASPPFQERLLDNSLGRLVRLLRERLQIGVGLRRRRLLLHELVGSRVLDRRLPTLGAGGRRRLGLLLRYRGGRYASLLGSDRELSGRLGVLDCIRHFKYVLLELVDEVGVLFGRGNIFLHEGLRSVPLQKLALWLGTKLTRLLPL